MNFHINKYGNGTVTRFDIVGSFFVNLFYNELYKKANNLKIQSNNKSTTDIYKSLLLAYADFTTKEEFFKQAVKGIHAYIISNTNLIDITHKECVDFLIREFVPDKMWNSIRENQKNKLFHSILSSVIKQFISKIISNYIKLVVDKRDNQENSTILQNEFLDIICLEKDKTQAKFVNPKDSQTISIEVHKNKVKTLMKAIEDRDRIINTLKDSCQKNVDIIKTLQKELKSKINDMKQMQINNIKQNIIQTNHSAKIQNEKIKPATEINTDHTTKLLKKNDERVEEVIKEDNDEDTLEGESSGSEDKEEGKDLLFEEADDYY